MTLRTARTSMVTIEIDGTAVAVAAGANLAVVLIERGSELRRSVGGEPRSVLCAMGICHECRVEIDGVSQQRACMRRCEEGMRVRTNVPS